MHVYVYVCLYVVCCVCIYGCGSKPVLSRGPPPPVLQTFVAGPLLQTLVADLCVDYCSLQGACRGGVRRRTPPSVTNLCREMVAQACYTANVFDSLPCVYVYIYTYTHTYTHMLYRFVKVLPGTPSPGQAPDYRKLFLSQVHLADPPKKMVLGSFAI